MGGISPGGLKSSILSLLGCCVLVEANAAGVQYENIRIPDQSGKVITVLGAIAPGDLGATLMHEHLFIDFYLPIDRPDRWKKTGLNHPESKEALELWNEPFSARNASRLRNHLFYNRDAMTLDDKADMAAEVLEYKRLGGSAIVDVTPTGLGPQPLKLQEIAKKTGTHIVMGTGFYRRGWHPDDMDRRTVSDLTTFMVRELVEGTQGTGIKAGIIGEISAEDMTFAPRDSDEVRVLRAAGRASQLTGAAISLHSHFRQMNNLHLSLDVLQEEGADLSRVIVGHISGIASLDMAFLESLLKRGVYLQFDTLGFPPLSVAEADSLSNRAMFEAILALITRGYANRLLVSHDVCTKFQLTKYGSFGLTYVHVELIPSLLKKGVQQRQIDKLVIENPRRILTFAAPRR